MTVSSNTVEFLARIAQRAQRLGASSEDKQRLLVRIGVKLQSAMVMNATRQRIVDTGALRQSLRYRIDGDSVEAGSFGVPYARFHEFGATLPPRAVRAMFANMRSRSKVRRASKGVFSGNPKTGGTLRARPFVRPAFEKNKAWIMQQIKDYLDGN